MFKNRQLTVKLDKRSESDAPEAAFDNVPFEAKTEVILRGLEGIGRKMFYGVCIYVLLDTRRQVAVAKVNNANR
jgi:hypothetical protein